MASGNTTATSNLRPILWQKELYQDVIDNLYFVKNGMMGTEDNNIVQLKDDLMKSKGDTIRYGLTAKLSGAGVTGDGELEGNEEQISSYSDTISINKKRFAVRLDGKLEEQRAAYDLRMDAKNKLSIRMQEFIERQIFLKLAGIGNTALTDVNGVTVSADVTWSNTPTVITNTDEATGYGARYLSAAYDPTSATGDNRTMAPVHVLTPGLISNLRVKAFLANPQIVPLKINGKNYYVLFIHPWQAMDLKNNALFRQTLQTSQVRGDDNPIFTGALGVWDGVIIHEHEYVPFLNVNGGLTNNFAGAAASISYNSNGSIPTTGTQGICRALLCGAQAIAFAKCQYENGWVEKDFDYRDKTGFATGLLGGIQKVTFNSKEYGVIALDTYATPIN
jgi:N4-gp56 family major capsid protein